MAERELQHLVDTLAERLERSVVLDDAEVNLIVASRHFGDADEQRVRAVLQRDVGGAAIGHIFGQGVARWTEAGVIPAREDLGMKSRLCQPIRWQGQLLGLLLVIDSDLSMTEADKREVGRVGNDIAVTMAAEQLNQDRLARDLEAAVLDLLGPDPARREAGLREFDRLGAIRPARFVSLTAVELIMEDEAVDSAESTSALRIATSAVARARSGYAAGVVIGGRGVLLQTWDRSPAHDRLRAQAVELRDALSSILGERSVSVAGVGRAHTALLDAHRSFDDACLALLAARRVPAFGGLAFAEELGPLSLLLRLPEAELTTDLLPEPLARLRDKDPSGRLVETLRCYLDHGGAAPATAAALHLHRTSLYYRMDRIQEFTGMDLADGRARLMLHLGLYLLDLVD